MCRFAGSCRFVYNKTLAMQRASLDAKDGVISYNKMARNLIGWKREQKTQWLIEAPSQSLHQTLKDLDRGLRDVNVLKAEHAWFACEVNGTVIPSAAGPHRSDSGVAQCRA